MPTEVPAHAFWFGEDQARYVITLSERDADAALTLARQSGVPVRRLGTTGAATLLLPDERPLKVADLQRRFESWLPAYMAGVA